MIKLILRKRCETIMIICALLIYGKIFIKIVLSTPAVSQSANSDEHGHHQMYQVESMVKKEDVQPLRRNQGSLMMAGFNEARYVKEGIKDGDPYKRNSFNVTASDLLPSNRKIRDTRQIQCYNQIYSKSLPSTSVIICFHNEARSTLLRTVISVLNRSPPNSIHEIILVDDFSDDPNDGLLLESIPKVKVLRNNKREGLVRSRIKGADYATAPVLTFLDSHCECNVGWLEPLLQRVMEDPRAIVCPVIDSINYNTFTYSGKTPRSIGVFNWGLVFEWRYLPMEALKRRKSAIEPMKTPVIAGGLFAINRLRFIETGKYDPEMDIWGGENLEISFRTWMCGGSMEIIPCSRVGHVYRKKHPYSFPKGNALTYSKNTKRTAEVWMDEYKEFYYAARPSARNKDHGNIDERIALRKRLNCTTFDWYIKNVVPQMSITDHKNVRLGWIHQEGYCLEGSIRDQTVIMHECSKISKTQVWMVTSRKEIMISHKLCLEGSYAERIVQLKACLPLRHKNQQWEVSQDSKSIRHLRTGYCLSHDSQGRLLLEKCDNKSQHQQWGNSLYKISTSTR